MNVELISFFVVSFFMAVTPGPSVIYVVSYSLRYGLKAGIVSTLGINFGSIAAILISAFGLSYLLDLYPNVIIFVQTIGGIYVVYLANLMRPRGSIPEVDAHEIKKESLWNLLRNGFITSILNPKDILFYTAFIPAFIPQSVTGSSYQKNFLLLAFSYMLIGFITKSAFAVFSGYAKNLLHSSRVKYINYIASLLLLCLGVYLVINVVSDFIH